MNPYASPLASKARSAAVVTVLLAAAILICASLFTASRDASAGITKNVRGYIYDENGIPLAGANVTVKAIRGGITRDTLWYDASEANGLYTVTFGFTNDLLAGDTIEVTALHSGHSWTNSTIATNQTFPIQFVNVTIPGVAIPEFGPLSVGMVGGAFIAVFLLIRRKRSGI